MLRLGSEPDHTREMDLDDIFFARLKLLIIMGNSYINNSPLGEYRRKSMLENARHIESESIDIGSSTHDQRSPKASAGVISYDHVFYQRVKLLAVMIKALGKGFPMGNHRKNAMGENIEAICQTLAYHSKFDTSFLRVAQGGSS
jgi:hypothetical protein